jgi:DNA-binding MarR family transcriptional regulator
MSERFEILERGRSLRRPSVTAWVRLLRVAQRVERDLGVQLRERWGLNNAQFDVLAHVGVEEGIVQQRLADSLLVTKGNVAQLLDRMEKRLYLTEEGRRLFDEVVPAHEALIAERLSVLSKEEQRHLSEILRKLDHSFDGEPSAVGGL